MIHTLMEREFEKFLGGPTLSPNDRLYVSISSSHVIRINQKCYQLIGKPPAVFLHFSRKSDVIAIEPVHSHHFSAAFPVKEQFRSGWKINAAPFCKHFGIRLDTTQRFIDPEIVAGKLHLKLSETVTVSQVRRKKAK